MGLVRSTARRRAFVALPLAAVLLLACHDVAAEPLPARTPAPTASPEAAAADAAQPVPPAFAFSPPPPEASPARQPETVEVAVSVLAGDLRSPARLAIAADGTRFVATSGGEILAHEAERTYPVAELAKGEALLGLAVDPGFPDQPYLYALVTDSGEGSRLYRWTLDGGSTPAPELVAELPASAATGNALAFGDDGNLYAAVGEPHERETAVDAQSLAAWLLNERDSPSMAVFHRTGAPCVPAGELQGAASDVWVPMPAPGVELPEGDEEPLPPRVPLWATTGVAAIAFYEHERMPQWDGSLFVVTMGGLLLRVSLDGGDCVDLATAELLYPGTYGRLIDVAAGPDRDLYLLAESRLLRVAPLDELGLLYPDLRTMPPFDITLDSARVDGEWQLVLRFTNVVVNLGEGPLEVRASGDGATVLQRIYDPNGAYIERPTGEVVFHWSHGHWHFDHFNRFELWERDEYERMLAGDADAAPRWVEDKVSMCLMDQLPVATDLPASPRWGHYGSECLGGAQGISVGWGDIYVFDIPEQWVLLEGGAIDDGDYVLRSIADPEGLLHESLGGRDPARESYEANAGVTWFTVAGSRITITHTEPGDSED